MRNNRIKLNQFEDYENLLHIGFGKSASTFLQKKIFPLVANFRKIEFIKTDESSIINKNNIYSSEMLLNWNPEYWNKSIKEIKKLSNKKTHIFLVIREPQSYLSSIYAHICLRELSKFKSIDNFFIGKEENKSLINKNKFENKEFFDVKKFSYKDLILRLEKNFKKITIIKLEKLFEDDFLRFFFKLNNSQILEIKNYLKITYNPGITLFSANITFLIANLYNLSIKFIFNSNKFRFNPNKKLNKISFTKKIYTKVFKIIFGCYPFLWKNFVINRLNYFPSSKFKINRKKLLSFKIKKLEKEYLDLEDYISI